MSTLSTGNFVVQCLCAIAVPFIGVGITWWLRRRWDIEDENHHRKHVAATHDT
jgi:hypothetical protein